MRDVLTIVAGLVVLVLAAALAVPPLIDWTSRRDWVEAGIGRAFGQEVRTEGAIDLRLLPSPRIRLRRLRIGRPGPDAVALDAMYVRAEIALTPLLGGEVRFLDTRIGRAEITLPVGAAGDWRMPARLLPEAARRKGWMLEDLRIEQFLLTATDPGTGRTDQYGAEGVRIQAGSPLGPWRFDGRSRARPVEIAIGEIGPDGKAPLKVGLGSAGARLDVDGQLAFEPAPGDMVRPRVTGTAKLLASTADLPLQAQATLSAGGGVAALSALAVEVGEGAGAIRLGGEGRYELRHSALALTLKGRRADLAPLRRILASSFVRSAWRADLPLALDLSLTLDTLALGADDELSRLSLSLAARGREGELRAFEATGPGRSLLRAHGSFRLGPVPGATGRVLVEAGDGQRLAGFLDGLGLSGFAGFVAPRPLEMSADMSLVDPVVSLRDLRIVQGDLRLSGAVRHTAAEAGGRPRLDAQIAVEGLDVAALPQAGPLFALARQQDLGLAIDARNVSHGGSKGGRITGRITTEGASVVVDSLEVRDLDGARATLSGRIAPDGTGRIEGRLEATRAAPLLDLFGQAWIGGLSRLLPAFMRDDRVDLRVEVEQTAGERPDAAAVRTVLRGQFGGAPFGAVTRTVGGVLSAFSVETDADALLGRGRDSGPLPASRFDLRGERGTEGRLAVSATGDVGGLAVRTVEPLRLARTDDRFETGAITVEGSDAAPLLGRLGLPVAGAVPLSLRIALARRQHPAIVVTGEVARTKVSAELSGPSPEEVGGTISVDRLSLPWLATTLALGPVAPPSAGTVWSPARFGGAPSLPFAGSVAVTATTLDMGASLAGRDAGFTLAIGPSGFRLSRFDARLGEARLRGDLALERQGGLAAASGDVAIEGFALPGLLGGPFSAGRVTAKVRFGASGESMAGLVANLGGAGDVTVDGLSVAETDPAAPARLAARVLKTDEPLAAQTWQPLLSQELRGAPLAATAPVAAPAALVGGILRMSPLRIEAETGRWQGSAALDLRTLSLDARGALQSGEPPAGWSGAPPTLGLGWSGPLGRVARTVDPAPLVSGLATNVLARELDRVDTFEQDAAERRRRDAREELERQRKLDDARRAREGARPPLTVPPPSPAPPASHEGAGG